MHTAPRRAIYSGIFSTFAWAARGPVYIEYRQEVVLEYCVWRGYVPAGKTYALWFLFAPRAMAAADESESAKLKLHIALYTTALGASHRHAFSHHISQSKPLTETSGFRWGGRGRYAGIKGWNKFWL